MKREYLPNPTVDFGGIVGEAGFAPLIHVVSGEVTTSSGRIPLGAAKATGRVRKVWVSALGCGRDDTNTLSVAFDVKINGTSCLTTQPKILDKQSAASAQRTSIKSGEAVIEAVLDQDNVNFLPGDVFTCNRTLTRTATPTTEISNVVLVVELEPRESAGQ